MKCTPPPLHENMIDFAAHFTIHAIKIGFLHFTWKVWSLKIIHLPIACQSERSLHYFHLDRISDSFAIHRSSSHTLLAAEKRFGVPSRFLISEPRNIEYIKPKEELEPEVVPESQ